MPEKFDRCVRKVRAKGGTRNPYAVCNAAMGRKKRKTQKKGKRHGK